MHLLASCSFLCETSVQVFCPRLTFSCVFSIDTRAWQPVPGQRRGGWWWRGVGGCRACVYMLALLLSPVVAPLSVCTWSSPPWGRTCALVPSPVPRRPPPAFPVKQAPWQLVLSLLSANDLSQPSSVKSVLTGFRIQGSHVFHSMALRMFFRGRRTSLVPSVAAPLSPRPAVRDVTPPLPLASRSVFCVSYLNTTCPGVGLCVYAAPGLCSFWIYGLVFLIKSGNIRALCR